MSSLHVYYNNIKKTVKLPPSASLTQVLQEACRKFKLDATKYKLQTSNGKDVELGLTIRFAQLGRNPKLNLKEQTGPVKVSSVKVAVQLVDGKRHQTTAPTNMTLWDVLKQVEEQQIINIVNQKGDRGDLQLVLVVMNREISSERLKRLTLRDVGASGSVLLRVRYTGGVRAKAEATVKVPSSKPGQIRPAKRLAPRPKTLQGQIAQMAANKQRMQAFTSSGGGGGGLSQSANAADRLFLQERDRLGVQPVGSAADRLFQQERDRLRDSARGMDEKQPEPPRQIPTTSIFDQMDVDTPLTPAAPAAAQSGGPSELEKRVMAAVTKFSAMSEDELKTYLAKQAAASTPAPRTGPLARPPPPQNLGPIERRERLLIVPKGRFNPRIFDQEDESFYDTDQGDYKTLKKSIREKFMSPAAIAARVVTRKTAANFEQTTIRIRLSQERFLEARFRPTETVGDLCNFLDGCVKSTAQCRYELYIAPPRQALTNARATFRSLGLVPAAIVNISTEAPIQLREELEAKAVTREPVVVVE